MREASMSFDPETLGRASVQPAADVRQLTVGASTAGLVATGSMTRGEFGLFRWEMSSRAGGAGPHIHRTCSESLDILDGTVSVYDGVDWTDARAGDVMYVPTNGVHGFRHETEEPATMLILFSPGSPREQYFEELAENIATGRQMTDEERTEWWARHDQYAV
jgi:mannose-6-phosphate isomerase-like protein (cupin superfamily)